MTLKTIIIVVLLLVIAAQLYVRLAPTDVSAWHRPPDMPESGVGDWTGERSFRAARTLDAAPEDVLEKLDRIALAKPRTERIAGAVDEGMMTYRTRSALWGFPDFTTVRAEREGDGTRLTIEGRARFGKKDMGVNEARIRGWLEELGVS